MDENINENDIESKIEEENLGEFVENNADGIQTDSEISSFRMKVIASLLGAVVIIGFGGALIVPSLLNVTSKPAIYLYPQVTQKVEIKLDKTIKYRNVIPKYKKKKGWLVEAEPTGIISDLQPQYTVCKKLPYKKKGFEYALEACKINKYPYIYWDGIQFSKKLPDKKTGFIVNRDNIVTFLTSKADELNFNTSEKKEFVKYWSSRMLDTKWKYFRVYFLQNQEVDNYLPIKVTPEPLSSNRVQIIIRKGHKNEKIEEQKLIPIHREGFTLVEWGGILKR